MYSILLSPLHETADEARKFFRDRFGLTKFKVEQPPFEKASYRPTLSSETRDHHIICIEISDTPYTNALDAFVLECKQRAVPVKLYVAIPSGDGDSQFKANLKRAKDRGVGVVEVSIGDGDVIHDALSLLLTGVRPYDPADFPAKFREAVSAAYSTFLNGDPAKGCSRLYDEIEGLCRSIGKKAAKRKAFVDMKKVSGYDFEKANWAPLIEFLNKNLDRRAVSCPNLTGALFSRIHGITPHRNEAGHKPNSVVTLTRRDRELRTRFEHALDLLRELIDASRPLSP